MASESSPKPSRIDFIPSTLSNVEIIGMLPPLRTGIGFFPKASSIALLAAMYSTVSIGLT